MPDTWGLGQLVASVRDTSEENERLGRMLVLFGFLSFVGGAGTLALTEAFRVAPEVLSSYREFAEMAAGVGLPAFFYGLVVLAEGDERAIDVGGIGTVLCGLAVLVFVVTRPEQLIAAGTSASATVVLVVYGLGVMTSAFAAGMAVLARLNDVDESELAADETEFIWGNPPES